MTSVELRRLRERMNGSVEDYEPGGIATRVETASVALKYDPEQLRGWDGRWIDEGGRGIGSRVVDTSESVEKRGARVNRVMGRNLHLGTDNTKTIAYGVWTPERDAIHRQIVDEIYARASDVPNQGRAIIAAGPPGAGKTTTLRDHAGIDLDSYLTLNPDDMKEELARRGLIPAVPDEPDLSPMERSTLVHAESVRLAQLLADRAYRDRKNVIWDITMSSRKSTAGHLSRLRDAGYGHVATVLVDVPYDVSLKRITSRYAEGVEDYRNGVGQGGRLLPTRALDNLFMSSDRSYARRTFKDMRDQFDAWVAYDNSVDGEPPRKVDQRGVITGD